MKPVQLEITKSLAEHIKWRAKRENLSVQDFLKHVLRETGSEYQFVLSIKKVFGSAELEVKVKGNPNLLIEWLRQNNLLSSLGIKEDD